MKKEKEFKNSPDISLTQKQGTVYALPSSLSMFLKKKVLRPSSNSPAPLLHGFQEIFVRSFI